MVSCRELWQIGCFIRNQYYEGLQKLHLSVDKRCVELSYILFSRQTCFYGFQKILSPVYCQTNWSRTINSRCCSFLQHSLFCNFTIRETILYAPNSSPKTCGRTSKSCNPWMSEKTDILLIAKDWNIAVAAKWNRRTSTCVTSIVEMSISMMANTVCQRLHMNGSYTQVPWVCVPLSIQPSGVWLK